jgi:plasmid stabilization system protein ParE
MKRRFRRAALADLREAVRWYDEQKPGLGSSFLSALEDILGRIEENPNLYPRILGALRRARFPRPFPHLVFYRVSRETLDIVAVFHPARDPEKWRRR